MHRSRVREIVNPPRVRVKEGWKACVKEDKEGLRPKF
jgi:hypothetical protein